MYRIVQKFGGTSVADTQRIKEAAKKVAFEHSQGHQVSRRGLCNGGCHK